MLALTPTAGQRVVQLLLDGKPSAVDLVTFARFTEPEAGAAEVELVLTSRDQALFDTYLTQLNLQPAPHLSFRHGTLTDTSQQWGPWLAYTVLFATGDAHGGSTASNYEIKINLKDRLYDADIDQNTVAHHGKVSDIIRKIFERYGFEQFAIEDTVGEGLHVQSFQTDLDFALERLTPRALNAKGRADYRLYLRDGIVHFHTPGFKATGWDLDWYRFSGENRLWLSDRSHGSNPLGAAGIRIIVADPLGGKSTEGLSDPAKVIRYAGTLPKIGTPSSSRVAHVTLSHNRESEPEAVTAYLYGAARQGLYEAKCVMASIPLLHPGDIINLRLVANGTSPWSGLWRLASAVHTIHRSVFQSALNLRRGETNIDILNPEVLDPKTFNMVDRSAPGEPLALRDSGNTTVNDPSTPFVQRNVNAANVA